MIIGSFVLPILPLAAASASSNAASKRQACPSLPPPHLLPPLLAPLPLPLPPPPLSTSFPQLRSKERRFLELRQHHLCHPCALLLCLHLLLREQASSRQLGQQQLPPQWRQQSDQSPRLRSLLPLPHRVLVTVFLPPRHRGSSNNQQRSSNKRPTNRRQ